MMHEYEDGTKYEANMFETPELCKLPDKHGGFWKNYDGSFSAYKKWCETNYGADKKTCEQCGGKFKKGKCSVKDDPKKLKCKNLSPEFCASIGCKEKEGKCKGKGKFKKD